MMKLTVLFIIIAAGISGCAKTSITIPIKGPIGVKIENSREPPPVIINNNPVSREN